MDPTVKNGESSGLRWIPHRIAAAYMVAGMLWIALSDGLLAWLTHTPVVFISGQMLKGLAFILTTGGLLYWLIRRHVVAMEHTQRLLQQSERRYRTLAEAAHDMIFVINRQGQIEYVNHFAALQFGCRPEDLIGRERHELFPPEVSAQQSKHLQQVLETGQPVYAEEITVFPGGKLWLGTWLVPIPNETGALDAVMGVSRDMTRPKQTEEALRRSTERLQLLYEIDRAILTAQSPQTLGQIALGRLKQLLPCQYASMMLFDLEKNRVLEIARVENGEDRPPAETPCSLEDWTQPETLQQGQAWYVPDLLASEPRPPRPEGRVPAGLRSFLVVPLLTDHELIGVFDLAAAPPAAFTPDQVEMVSQLAGQIAIAIRQAHLSEQVQRRARELAALNKAAQAITSTLDLPTVLNLVITEVKNLLEAEAASVLLHDPASHELVFAAAAGPAAERLVGVRMAARAGIAGWVLQEKQPTLINGAYQDRRFYAQIDALTGLTTRSLVAAPLLFKGMTSGVIEAINKSGGAFTQHDLEVLETMAGSAAIAIENARLYQSEKEQRELAETLREVGATLAATLDMDIVLDRLLEQVSRVMPNDATNIMLVEDDHVSIVRWRGYARFGVKDYIAGVRFRVNDTPNLRSMVETGQPIAIPDTLDYPGWIRVPEMAWLRSYAGAPIRVRGVVLGFLNVDSTTPGFFGPQQAGRLQAFADQAAIALANAQLYKAQREQAQDLAAINAVIRAIGSSLELDTMLHAVTRELGHLITFERASLTLINQDQITFTVVALEDSTEPLLRQGMTLRIEDSAATQDIRNGRTHITPDLATECDFLAERLLYQAGARSRVNVPLVHAGQVIGSINMMSTRPAAFGRREIALLEQISNSLAIAIENARLFQETRRRLEELAVVSEVALAGCAGQSFDIVARATQAMSQLWPEASLGFLFVDEQDMALCMHPSYHAAPSGGMVRLPFDQGLTGLAVREQRPLRVGDVTTHPHYVCFIQETRSEMVAPLIVNGRVMGAINVESPRLEAFSEKDLRLLTTLAGQLAVLLEKTRLDEALAGHAAVLEQRVAERTAEIRNQQARTQAILDALGEGVVVTDLNGTILYVNPTFEKLTGYSAAELIGKNPRIWQGGQTQVEFYRDMWNTVLSGKMWRGEMTNKRKDGTFYDATVTIAPIFHGDPEQLAGFVGVHHDITRLKELDRLKSEFVSNVSHELRTPLSNIKLYLGLLERSLAEPHRLSQYIQVLQREELRLEHLIEDLLMLSRIDLKSMEFQYAPVYLDALARQLVDDRQTLAATRGLQLTFVSRPIPVPPVLADAAAMSQVLTNLISNAIHYTPPGGTVTLYVHEQCAADGTPGVAVTVQDTGLGLSPRDREHLFDRFYRGEAARQTGAPGTGLGLSICLEIVTRHHGHLTFESEWGKGSAFTVWLPAWREANGA